MCEVSDNVLGIGNGPGTSQSQGDTIIDIPDTKSEKDPMVGSFISTGNAYAHLYYVPIK